MKSMNLIDRIQMGFSSPRLIEWNVKRGPKWSFLFFGLIGGIFIGQIIAWIR